MPKVSVIVPVYNVEKYIDRCISSLINQTLKDIEIILVDDESPDNCPSKCDGYVANDSRIKVIHKKNGGLGYARNSGLEIASGEYIAFVDSDDFVDHRMYEELYKEAISLDADVVYSNCYLYKDEQNISYRTDVTHKVIFDCREQIEDFLLDIVGPLPEYSHDVKYMMSVWHAIYRSRIFHENNVKFVSERDLISEDLVFDIDYLLNCRKIVYLPSHHYYYCFNENSLSHSNFSVKNERFKSFENAIKERLSKYFPEEKYLLHFQRLQFLHLRSLITNVLKTKKIFGNTDDVLNDQHWQSLLVEYPYKRMDFKHKIFFSLIKYKCMFLLKCLLYISK